VRAKDAGQKRNDVLFEFVSVRVELFLHAMDELEGGKYVGEGRSVSLSSKSANSLCMRNN
jgi:hypothetical protein